MYRTGMLIEPDRKAGFVLVDPHYAAWRRFRATEEHPERGFTVTLDVEVSERGEPRCLGLEITPPVGESVTHNELRQVPVARLLAHATTVATLKVGESPGPGTAKLEPLVRERASRCTRSTREAHADRARVRP